MNNIFGGGSNLPPGCSVNDIPGNSPEDGRWEAIEDAFWSNTKNCSDENWMKFDKAQLDDSLMDVVTKAISYGIEIGTKQCYENAQDNKVYDKEYMESILHTALHEIERLSMVTGYSGEGHFETLRKLKEAIKKLEGE